MSEREHQHGGLKVKAASVGAASAGAFAVGALAVGALAIGALAIGRVAIRRVIARQVKFRVLEIENLKVTRVEAKEIIVDSLKLPNPKLKFDTLWINRHRRLYQVLHPAKCFQCWSLPNRPGYSHTGNVRPSKIMKLWSNSISM